MNKQRIYTGNIIDLENNKQKCLKQLLNLDKIEILDSKCDNVYRDNDRVIKILKYSNDELLTCKLTKEASKLGIGAKYLGYDIIYHKSILSVLKMKPVYIYLYTEYNMPINVNVDKKLVKELAEKIANSKLLLHPDFWYKNLVLNRNNILVAIDWDGILYNEYKRGIAKKDNFKISRKNLVQCMLNTYLIHQRQILHWY